MRETQLEVFDALEKGFRKIYKILILSPESYRLLNQRRKKRLHDCTLILSEQKSLDYLAQLPRLMEEASFRKDLHTKRKVLESLMSQKVSQTFGGNSPLVSFMEIPEQLYQNGTDKGKGLRIILKAWAPLKRAIGEIAASEILDLTSRTISQAVRGSDRILQNQENEFIVFLSNVDSNQLRECSRRISVALRHIEILQNNRSKNFDFEIKRVDQLPEIS
jgi:hypothetical protein